MQGVTGGCWGLLRRRSVKPLFFETSRCSFLKLCESIIFLAKFGAAVSTELVPKGGELPTVGEVTHRGPGSPVVSSQMLDPPKLRAFKFLKKEAFRPRFRKSHLNQPLIFRVFFLSFRKGNLVVFPSGGCFTIHQQRPQRKGGVVALKGAV